jgi:hypothetical protein
MLAQLKRTILEELPDLREADLKTFVYMQYTRDDYYRALAEAPFMVAYSPFETFGQFHLEARIRDVPVFALKPDMVPLYFTPGVSGEVVNIGVLADTNQRTNWQNREPLNCTINGVYGEKHGCFTVNTTHVLQQLRHFLMSRFSYKPLLDLAAHNLLYPKCGEIVQRLHRDHTLSEGYRVQQARTASCNKLARRYQAVYGKVLNFSCENIDADLNRKWKAGLCTTQRSLVHPFHTLKQKQRKCSGMSTALGITPGLDWGCIDGLPFFQGLWKDLQCDSHLAITDAPLAITNASLDITNASLRGL